MSYSFNQAAFADGIQELSFGECDAVGGGAGSWNDLGSMVLGGMGGGAVSGAIAGSVGGPEGAGLGAVAGAIGGGVGAILTWYTIRAV